MSYWQRLYAIVLLLRDVKDTKLYIKLGDTRSTVSKHFHSISHQTWSAQLGTAADATFLAMPDKSIVYHWSVAMQSFDPSISSVLVT